MAWSPEMELIDQLLGGDLPLPAVARLFPEEARARLALMQYVSDDVVALREQGAVLPTWRSQELLRQPEPFDKDSDIHVSLTDKGAKAFQERNWDRL